MGNAPPPYRSRLGETLSCMLPGCQAARFPRLSYFPDISAPRCQDCQSVHSGPEPIFDVLDEVGNKLLRHSSIRVFRACACSRGDQGDRSWDIFPFSFSSPIKLSRLTRDTIPCDAAAAVDNGGARARLQRFRDDHVPEGAATHADRRCPSEHRPPVSRQRRCLAAETRGETAVQLTTATATATATDA